MAMSEWEWAAGTGQEHIDRITRFHLDSLAVPVEQRLRPSDPGRHDFPIGLDENGRKFPVPARPSPPGRRGLLRHTTCQSVSAHRSREAVQ